ncbi:MAG: hypothetical protein WBV79_13160 [Rhodomicrobium sp.]
MTPDALEGFRMKDGWKVGVDGSVAIIAVGARGRGRYEYHPQPDRRFYLRSERAHVQPDARRFEDQPHLPLMHRPARPQHRQRARFGWSATRSSYRVP